MTSVLARSYLDPTADGLLRRFPAPRRALFLDRDGVINVDYGYVYTREGTKWLSGIFDLCRAARDAGYVLIVVTNQAGIARGLYDEGTFLEYTRWVHAEFERCGVALLATYYCPHHSVSGLGAFGVACDCRKPAPGMILAAGSAHDIELPGSILLGDKPSDIEAGLAAGVGVNVLLGVVPESLRSNGRVREVHTNVHAQELVIQHANRKSVSSIHVSR